MERESGLLLTATNRRECPNKEQLSMHYSHRDCKMLPIAAKLLQTCVPEKCIKVI